MPWWKRFRSTKATLPAATTASAVCAIALAAIWFTGESEQPEVERFGSTMANTLAKTTAGDLLDNQRINLAGMVHADLENAIGAILRHAREAQWHTYVIIEGFFRSKSFTRL